jgi:hypothetical protein
MRYTYKKYKKTTKMELNMTQDQKFYHKIKKAP